LIEMSWKDGVIVTDAGEIIARPGISPEELRASPLGASATIEGVSPDYPRIVFNPVVISGYECCASVGFDHDNLDRVMIVVTDNTANRFSFVTGFDSRHNGPEVEFLEGWVRQEVGANPPVHFTWGRIVEVFDTFAGFARILFIYGARR
jgi:hypothetical protein